MLVNIKQIKPKNLKKDDKYSVNLYKFIKQSNYKDYLSSIHVYYDKNIGSFEEPKFKDIDWNNLISYNIYIGLNMMEDIWDNNYTKSGKLDFGQVIAKNLSSIFAGRKLKETGTYCAFGRNFVKRDWIDITEEFWNRYIEQGLCMFNRHEYERINCLYRKCKYCGKQQIKKIEAYTDNYESWEDII